MTVNAGNAVAYQSAAEIQRWRAEWALSQGLPVERRIRAGREYVRASPERNPGLALAQLTDAALLIIRAEAEPASRRRWTAEAGSRLEEARRLNPMLSREIDALAERLGRL